MFPADAINLLLMWNWLFWVFFFSLLSYETFKAGICKKCAEHLLISQVNTLFRWLGAAYHRPQSKCCVAPLVCSQRNNPDAQKTDQLNQPFQLKCRTAFTSGLLSGAFDFYHCYFWLGKKKNKSQRNDKLCRRSCCLRFKKLFASRTQGRSGVIT